MRAGIPVLSLLSAAALTSGLAMAQMSDVPIGKWWKRPAVVKTLDLTAEQQDKLDQILQKNRREFVDLKADIEKKQLDVEDLMAKKDSDPKKVEAAVDALGQSRLEAPEGGVDDGARHARRPDRCAVETAARAPRSVAAGEARPGARGVSRRA